MDCLIGDKAVHLLANELLYAVPKLHHALDTLFCRCVQVGLDHTAVLAVIHLAVYNGIAVVFDIRVCGNRCADLLVFSKVGQRRFLIFAADFLHRFMEQRPQICTFEGVDGIILLAVLRALRRWGSKHHFRMLCEVAVDRKAILGLPKVNPAFINLDGSVAFLQEDDVRHHLCTGVGFERIVGQTNGTEQLRPLRDVFADFG